MKRTRAGEKKGGGGKAKWQARRAGMPAQRRSFGFAGYQQGRELAHPGQELKAFDVASATLVFDPPAGPPNFATNLNCPVNGAELYQRVGRKTYMKSIHIRGWILNVATSVQDIGRLIIYYDSQPNGAAPAYAALMQDSNAAGASSTLSEINLTNRQRFQILRDIPLLFPAVTNTAGVLTNLAYPETDKQFKIDEFIKLKGLETVFNGTNGGTVADITSGAIGMCAVCQTSNNAWELSFTTRLRYYD